MSRRPGYWSERHQAKRAAMTEEQKEEERAARRAKYAARGNTDVARAQKRRASRKMKTGFTQQDVDKAIAIQGGLCAGCGIDLSNIKFHADHCHGTGMKRGLLCQSCNWVLGHAKDRTDVLARLIEYLKSPPMSAFNED